MSSTFQSESQSELKFRQPGSSVSDSLVPSAVNKFRETNDGGRQTSQKSDHKDPAHVVQTQFTGDGSPV